MDLASTALIQELGGLAKLGASNDRIVYEEERFAPDQLVDRYQLHVSDKVPLGLYRGHEGSRPCGRVFDKGS